MNIYCISDIHGRFDEFMAMLELIQFDGKQDKLYVLGDMIDWGPKSVEVMRYCMENQDYVTTLMGNHEWMMIQFFKEAITDVRNNYHPWMRNGGKKTLAQLNYKVTRVVRQRLLGWVKTLPYFEEAEINGRKFYLCHSYPYTDTGRKEHDEETAVWRRVAGEENPLHANGYGNDIILVAGHTPTKYEYYFPPDEKEPYLISNTSASQKIMIDCCAKLIGNQKLDKYDTARLACIRLNDYEEFYVGKQQNNKTETSSAL